MLLYIVHQTQFQVKVVHRAVECSIVVGQTARACHQGGLCNTYFALMVYTKIENILIF